MTPALSDCEPWLGRMHFELAPVYMSKSCVKQWHFEFDVPVLQIERDLSCSDDAQAMTLLQECDCVKILAPPRRI
jgi:hypothetical protein